MVSMSPRLCMERCYQCHTHLSMFCSFPLWNFHIYIYFLWKLKQRQITTTIVLLIEVSVNMNTTVRHVNKKDIPFLPEPLETMMYHFVILPFDSSHIAKWLNATFIWVWSSDGGELFVIRVKFCLGGGRGATKV